MSNCRVQAIRKFQEARFFRAILREEFPHDRCRDLQILLAVLSPCPVVNELAVRLKLRGARKPLAAVIEFRNQSRRGQIKRLTDVLVYLADFFRYFQSVEVHFFTFVRGHLFA